MTFLWKLRFVFFNPLFQLLLCGESLREILPHGEVCGSQKLGALIDVLNRLQKTSQPEALGVFVLLGLRSNKRTNWTCWSSKRQFFLVFLLKSPL